MRLIATQPAPLYPLLNFARLVQFSRGLLAAATQGLAGLTAIAVVAAGSAVVNTVRMNLLTRRGEIATLRTLGASVGQVEGIFFRQALLNGVVGSFIGTAGGWLFAWSMAHAAGVTTGLPLASPGFDVESLLLGFGVGLTLSLVAVWWPARAYCRCPPLDLFHPPASARHSRTPRWAGRPGATFYLAVALWGLTAAAEGWFAADVGQALFPAMIALLFASLAALLGPWLPWAIARSERWVTVVFGVGGALAVRLLGRRPERTARTATIVFVATTMTVGFGHTMLNTLVDVRAWAGRAIPADFLVRGSMPDPGFLVTSALPESIGGELRQVSGAQAVDQITFISSRAGGTPVLVLARTFPSEGPLPLDLRGRDPGPIRRGLASGEAVVADGLARSLAIRVGDAIVLDTPRGPHSVRVAGTVTEYAGGGAALYLDWHTSQSLFGPSGVHAFLVSAGPNDRPAVAAQLKTFCTTRGLLLQSNAELSSTIDSLTQALTAALWSILVLVFVVAGLGVGNAIAVSTHEQRRDMELLRAIGMTSSAIRGSTRIQGVLLMAVGAVPGVLGGVTLALILARVIEGLWGYRVPFHLEWGLILVTFGLTTITGAAAGPACGFPVHKLRQIKD